MPLCLCTVCRLVSVVGDEIVLPSCAPCCLPQMKDTNVDTVKERKTAPSQGWACIKAVASPGFPWPCSAGAPTRLDTVHTHMAHMTLGSCMGICAAAASCGQLHGLFSPGSPSSMR